MICNHVAFIFQMTGLLQKIVILLALLQAGWMAFDGARAFIIGDYLTPTSGEYAGQLGPWANLVAAAGIEPRSTLMKTIFVVYGVLWLIVVSFFAQKQRWAWTAMLVAAMGSLWYLPFGTVSSMIQIALLGVIWRNSVSAREPHASD